MPQEPRRLASLSTSGNLLLRHLKASDGGMLLPHLRSVVLTRGTTLFHATESIDSLYFPEAGLLTLEENTGGKHVEIAVVGREGMLGWPALLGSDRSMHNAVVQAQEGCGVRIRLDVILTACRASATLSSTLLGFVQAVMVQMARTITLARQCSLEQRMVRWILMRHDRVGGDQILIRQDEIAAALDVRRASITDRLHILEGERLISCRRGRILICDRDGLERSAGNAYGEAEYRGFTAPFGKSPHAITSRSSDKPDRVIGA